VRHQKPARCHGHGARGAGRAEPTYDALMRTALRCYGLSRAVYGAWLLAQPERAVASWFGGAQAGPAPKVLLRSVGARDIVIGLATAAGPLPATAAFGAILVDGVDLAATLAAQRRIPGKAVAKAAAVMTGYGALGLALLVADRRARQQA
jgi:hypothetical protein